MYREVRLVLCSRICAIADASESGFRTQVVHVDAKCLDLGFNAFRMTGKQITLLTCFGVAKSLIALIDTHLFYSDAHCAQTRE